MLVERTVRVGLVDNEHRPAAPLIHVLMEEYINVVAVGPLRAFDIAVGVGHGGFPWLAVFVRSAALAARRILDGDVEPGNLDVPLLVVACLLLPLGRLGVNLCRSRLYSRL